MRVATLLWLLILFILVLGNADVFAQNESAEAPRGQSGQMALPVVFEKNQGQSSVDSRFIARNTGGEVQFTDAGPDIFFGRDPKGVSVQFRVLGSGSPMSVMGENELRGKVNYFSGSDEALWRRSIPIYEKVIYRGILPGVDLLFYGNRGQLEHDFIVAPGTDPASIRFRLVGAEKLSITPLGDLSLTAGNSVIFFRKPVAYQKVSGDKVSVEASFRITDSGVVSFNVGKHDPNLELTVDPVLTFSTYLDGSYSDTAQTIATDSVGNIYVAGYTESPDYPMVHPYLAGCGGCPADYSAFISKLDPTGHTLLFSTYIGGVGTSIDDIAIDSSGNLVAVGYTTSSSFPKVGAFASPSSTGAYALSLDAAGSNLNYSEILGAAESGYFTWITKRFAVAVDNSGNAYAVGNTGAYFSISQHIPITPGTYASTVPNATSALFAVKLAADGSEIYGTVIPTLNSSNIGFDPVVGGVTLDPQGNLYISGTAIYSGLPTTPGVIGPAWIDQSDTTAFVLALNPTASDLVFSTYLPGADVAGPLFRAPDGTLYVTGSTAESNLPISQNAFQKTLSGTCYISLGQLCNGYIFHLDALGTTVLGATYLSGPIVYSNQSTQYESIALDSSGNVYVGGNTSVATAPLVNPVFSVLDMTGNSTDMGAVLEGLTEDLSDLVFGSYFNGVSAGSQLRAMTIDTTNHIVFTGTTYAYSNFPTTAGVVQPNAPTYIPPGASGYPHQFVGSINLTETQGFSFAATGSRTSQTISPGGTATYTFSISSAGGPSTPAVTLSASGAPTGSTATLTPTSTPAGIGATNVTLTIFVPASAAMRNSGYTLGRSPTWIAFGFLFLPFIPRTWRSSKCLKRLICIALLTTSLGGLATLTGCSSGGGGGGNGNPTQAGTYTITVTATSGTMSHTTTVTLVVT